MKGMEMLIETFDESVYAAVRERLRGKTPAGLGRNHNTSEAIRNQIVSRSDAFANALRKE